MDLFLSIILTILVGLIVIGGFTTLVLLVIEKCINYEIKKNEPLINAGNNENKTNDNSK